VHVEIVENLSALHKQMATTRSAYKCFLSGITLDILDALSVSNTSKVVHKTLFAHWIEYSQTFTFFDGSAIPEVMKDALQGSVLLHAEQADGLVHTESNTQNSGARPDGSTPDGANAHSEGLQGTRNAHSEGLQVTRNAHSEGKQGAEGEAVAPEVTTPLPVTNARDVVAKQTSFLFDELESLLYQTLGNTYVDSSIINYAKVLVVLFIKHNVRKAMESIAQFTQITQTSLVSLNEFDIFMLYTLRCIVHDSTSEQTLLDIEEYRSSSRLRTNSFSIAVVPLQF